MRTPLNTNTMGAEETDAAKGEAARADYIDVKHAAMVNSGCSADLLAAFTLADPICALARRRRHQAGRVGVAIETGPKSHAQASPGRIDA